MWKLRAALPTGLRARVASALPDKVALALTERLELRGQDWAATRAFAQPADNQGYVRLNLRGRERDGIVEPAQAEALMDEIASGLMTFTDPDGTPAVKAVERVADTFDAGMHSDRLPDLIVRWSDRAATRLTGVRVAAVRDGEPARARQRPLRQPHRGRRLGAGGARRVDAAHAVAPAPAGGHRSHGGGAGGPGRRGPAWGAAAAALPPARRRVYSHALPQCPTGPADVARASAARLRPLGRRGPGPSDGRRHLREHTSRPARTPSANPRRSRPR